MSKGFCQSSRDSTLILWQLAPLTKASVKCCNYWQLTVGRGGTSVVVKDLKFWGQGIKVWRQGQGLVVQGRGQILLNWSSSILRDKDFLRRQKHCVPLCGTAYECTSEHSDSLWLAYLTIFWETQPSSVPSPNFLLCVNKSEWIILNLWRYRYSKNYRSRL